MTNFNFFDACYTITDENHKKIGQIFWDPGIESWFFLMEGGTENLELSYTCYFFFSFIKTRWNDPNTIFGRSTGLVMIGQRNSYYCNLTSVSGNCGELFVTFTRSDNDKWVVEEIEDRSGVKELSTILDCVKALENSDPVISFNAQIDINSVGDYA